MTKKHPNRARGAYTVQENMRRKYQVEAWREMANIIQDSVKAKRAGIWTTPEYHGYYDTVMNMLYESVNNFMKSKGIEPKLDL